MWRDDYLEVTKSHQVPVLVMQRNAEASSLVHINFRFAEAGIADSDLIFSQSHIWLEKPQLFELPNVIVPENAFLSLQTDLSEDFVKSVAGSTNPSRAVDV